MNREEIDFFNELLAETKIAYNQSSIKGKGWWYSVTATRIMKNKPLIVGFNWGVDSKSMQKGDKHEAQKEYPDVCFEDIYKELGSLKRVKPYFEKYYPDALSGMQTNFCFFRSEKEDQVSEGDLELSSKLFDKYLDYSAPSIIISFSKKLGDYLEKKGKLKHVQKEDIKSGKKIIQPIRAKFQDSNNNVIAFVSLPHPNYPISGEARDKAWEFCFSAK